MYPAFCPWMIFRWIQPDYRTVIYACPLWAHCGPHHRAVFLGSIIACLSRLLGNMISVASDKGEGVRQELLEKVGWWWGGVRWRQLKLALHVRPAQSIATNLVSQQNYISIQDLNPRSWQQAKGPKIRSNSQECFCSHQGHQLDRCHHRCRRKTFKTGQYVTPWKTLLDLTTGSSWLPACNQRIADCSHPSS